MDYPKQEHKTGINQRATVSKRDSVDIYVDAASGGSTNPSYTTVVATDVMAEVLQVSGGEVVRGKQVEAGTVYVVTVDKIDGIVNARCKINITSGVYSGVSVYSNRVYFETSRARPVNLQIHCGTHE